MQPGETQSPWMIWNIQIDICYLFSIRKCLSNVAQIKLPVYHQPNTSYWRYRLRIFLSFYVSIWVIKISVVFITSIRISSVFVHINISICTKLHTLAYVGPLNKIEGLFFPLSLYHTRWAIKAYDNQQKHKCKYLFVIFCLKVR